MECAQLVVGVCQEGRLTLLSYTDNEERGVVICLSEQPFYHVKTLLGTPNLYCDWELGTQNQKYYLVGHVAKPASDEEVEGKMPLIVIQDDNLYLNTGELNGVNYDTYRFQK